MATKIITKEFPIEILSMFKLKANLFTYRYLRQEKVGLDSYSMLFQEIGRNNKYAWKVYLGTRLTHIKKKLVVYPVGIAANGDYFYFDMDIASKATSVTGMLVKLKPVPTWLPVYDDEISTNTINELLTGST